MSDTLQIRFADVLPESEALELMAKLQRHGLTVVALDPETGEEVHRVTPKVKPVSSIVRDERGLTEKYGCALDLMLRPEGATMRDLQQAGASSAKSLSMQYAMDMITKATKGRYVKADVIPRVEVGPNGRPSAVLAYTMRELPEDERAAALVAVEAALEAKGQNGKRKGGQSEAEPLMIAAE